MKIQNTFLTLAMLAAATAGATSVKVGGSGDDFSMKVYKVQVENQDKEIAAFLATQADTLNSDSKLAPLVDFLKSVGYQGSDRQVLTQFAAEQK